MKQNEQLVEDIFDLSIMYQFFPNKIRCDISARDFIDTKKDDLYVTIKELMGREKAGVVVYVSEYGEDCINNNDVDLVKIESEKTYYYNIKAIIQLVEEE
jgi:hypothetical protein